MARVLGPIQRLHPTAQSNSELGTVTGSKGSRLLWVGREYNMLCSMPTKWPLSLVSTRAFHYHRLSELSRREIWLAAASLNILVTSGNLW
jgi:hypothetical protein